MNTVRIGVVLLLSLIFVNGCATKPTSMDAKKENGSLNIYDGDQLLLSYRFDPVSPPEGVDSIYTRSGFIHPVNTLKGHRLTRMHPEDHWHHLGIWNPWTHVEYRGDTLDFWNLDQAHGTIRFAGFEEIDSSDDVVKFKVKHEHVVTLNGRNEVALNEFQTITLTTQTDSSYTIDFDLKYQPATQFPFKILEYRYAGMGWRATEEWDNKNSMVLASGGETRKNADGALAEWVLVQGKLGEEYGGAILMGSPENENHPEPIRVWPEDMYDRGDMFLCMFPTKYADWEMLPGNTYHLNYRMVIFDGEADVIQAKQAFLEYTK